MKLEMRPQVNGKPYVGYLVTLMLAQPAINADMTENVLVQVFISPYKGIHLPEPICTYIILGNQTTICVSKQIEWK